MSRKLNPSLLADWWTIAKRTKRVYYVQDYRSRTNMGAAYSLYVVWQGALWKAWPAEGSPDDWTYSEPLAKALGHRCSNRWRAFYRGGCGYDRVHDIVYSLASYYAPKGDKARSEALNACNAISIERLGDHG